MWAMAVSGVEGVSCNLFQIVLMVEVLYIASMSCRLYRGILRWLGCGKCQEPKVFQADNIQVGYGCWQMGVFPIDHIEADCDGGVGENVCRQ